MRFKCTGKVLVGLLLLAIAGCGSENVVRTQPTPIATQPAPTATEPAPTVPPAPLTPTPTEPQLGGAECEGDTCQHDHSTLVAIAHSNKDPTGTILYRVTVQDPNGQELSTGTEWGDGVNGFFYQATVAGGAPTTYVPFNGVGVDSDNRPTLRRFSFIVPASTSTGTITVTACATNYQGGTTTTCTKTLWTDTYDGLPEPDTDGPPWASVGTTSLEFESSDAVVVVNKGIYGGMVSLHVVDGSLVSKPDIDLTTPGYAEWFAKHLVFLDSDKNAYTNDLFGEEFAALPLDEAAYPISPGSTMYRTKYGSTTAVESKSSEPAYFFYAKTTSTGGQFGAAAKFLYDTPTSSGNLGGAAGSGNDGSAGEGSDISCGGETPCKTITLAAPSSDVNIITGIEAGTQETRTICLTSGEQCFTTSEDKTCGAATNPLAVNTETAYNLANYVIDDTVPNGNWGRVFPPALYYVLPTGFGNCTAGTATSSAPFCETQTTPSTLVSYVPQYTDLNGNAGELNGGSTDNPYIGAFTLADEYALVDLTGSTQNRLVWFDNCGSGHIYYECSGSDCSGGQLTLGQRKVVPTPPGNNGEKYSYRVANHLSRPLVFSKECCASWYQANMVVQGNQQVTVQEPPQAIDNGYGVFVPGGRSFTHSTIFGDEAIVVYDAATGSRLTKLRLNSAGTRVYACADPQCYGAPSRDGCPSITASTTGTYSANIDLYDAGTGGQGEVSCEPVGACPFGMTTGSDGVFVTCTATASSFLLGIPDWAAEILPAVNFVQVRAWGGAGQKGQGGTGESSGYHNGGPGGAGGLALTAVDPADPIWGQNLYAYVGVGDDGSSHGYGGASSILTRRPLSSFAPSDLDFGSKNTSPSQAEILLLAGGGGGGGSGEQSGCTGGAAGAGGVAVANASSASLDDPGTPASAKGADSYYSDDPTHTNTGFWDGAPNGRGGNKNGDGDGGTGNATGADGIGGWGDGTSTKWNNSGSLIPLTSWGPGAGSKRKSGDNDYGGTGGGGYGGGGAGGGTQGCGAGWGGGGGGSWAAGNTINDPTAPPYEIRLPSNPGGVNGSVQFAYLASNRAILYRLNAGGGTLAATDGGPPWVPDMNYLTSTGQNTDSVSHAIDLKQHKLTPLCPFNTSCGVIGAGAPQALFQTERWDPSGGSEMQYAFPVTNGDFVEINLFLAETDSAITKTGGRVFNVKVEGAVPGVFSKIDQLTEADVVQYRGVRLSYVQHMSDNMLNLEFDHVTENPAIKGIEIRSLRSNFASRGLLTSTRQPRPSQCLTLNDTGVVVSNASNFRLIWQDDGDLVINNPQGLAIWRAGTDNASNGGSGGSELCFQSDGNLVIKDASGTTLFETETADSQNNGSGGVFMSLQDNCNLEIIQLANQALFNTNTTCSTTPLATFTPMPTATRTPPPTRSPTITPTPPNTPTASHTPTPTRTITPTHTITPTRTVTPTGTVTPTASFTPTPSPAPTETATPHLVEVLTNELTSTNHPQPAACLQLPGDDGVVLDNGVAQLIWRSDGDLVLSQGDAILWESNTSDSELGGNGGRQLCFPSSLTIQNGSGTTIFSTQTLEGKILRLDAGCNLAVLSVSGSVLFQTSTTCD